MSVQARTGSAFDPQRWGISLEAVQGLGERLRRTWQRLADCFRTKTRDGGEYAYSCLGGLLRMKEGRNFANIGRQVAVPGQNIQHFMTNSPWSAQAVSRRVQQEIAAKPGLERGGMLLLDESADEKAGEGTVGSARQYNGRMGKVDLSQVGVFLGYGNISASASAPVWTWVDGEVFIPEALFAEEMQEATQVVVQHLVNRTRAKKSRLTHRQPPGPAP